MKRCVLSTTDVPAAGSNSLLSSASATSAVTGPLTESSVAAASGVVVTGCCGGRLVELSSTLLTPLTASRSSASASSTPAAGQLTLVFALRLSSALVLCPPSSMARLVCVSKPWWASAATSGSAYGSAATGEEASAVRMPVSHCPAAVLAGLA